MAQDSSCCSSSPSGSRFQRAPARALIARPRPPDASGSSRAGSIERQRDLRGDSEGLIGRKGALGNPVGQRRAVDQSP
jgi:hypothetical protein